MRSGRTVFVYAGGREARWEAAVRGEGPAEFFYGAVEWKRGGEDVAVLDWPEEGGGKLVSWAGKAVARLLPPKTRLGDVWAAGRLLRKLRGADWIVGTSSGVAFALAVWKRLGRLPGSLAGIHCGVVNHQHAPGPRRAARWLGGAMKKFVFAENEIHEMAVQFGWDDVESLWFGADAGYWTPGESSGRSDILAVGNDSRRDYETLIRTARLCPEREFQIVTRRDLGGDLPGNVRVIRGNWKEGGVSDAALRELYRGAACVVVPLLESVQPSGQSVAMQAMLCGAPVVMSRTSGWWGGSVLREGRHIESAEAGNAESLRSAIARAMEPGRHPAREVLLEEGWTSSGWAERMRKAGAGLIP